MVQIIENHAELAGTLVAVQPDPTRPGFVTVTVDVSHAAPVQGFPNLLADTIGQRVAVTARADSAFAAREPGPVSFHARKTGPNLIFADPDPRRTQPRLPEQRRRCGEPEQHHRSRSRTDPAGGRSPHQPAPTALPHPCLPARRSEPFDRGGALGQMDPEVHGALVDRDHLRHLRPSLSVREGRPGSGPRHAVARARRELKSLTQKRVARPRPSPSSVLLSGSLPGRRWRAPQ